MFNYEKQVSELANYFRSGEKKTGDFKLGVEFEHFVVYRDTLKAVSYYEAKGIEDTLKQLLNRGWKGKYEDEYLIGLEKEGTTITLEPGSQLEISIKASESISEIEKVYIEFLKDITPILEDKNQCLMAMGYQPETSIKDIKILPKKRYRYMFEHFKLRGKYAHNMMKGTASTQVTVDYKSEEDFIKKFKVANGLSAVISALFDNSPFFEGEAYDKNGLRVSIWNNCDSDRCGIVHHAMDNDFSYRKYAQYILNGPPILLSGNDNLIYTGSKLSKELLDPDNYHITELEHILTMFFPDVRLKKFIEIRMADSVPYPLGMSLVALWKGLLYNEENLNLVYSYVNDLKLEDILVYKEEVIAKGIKGQIKDQYIYEIGEWLIGLAERGFNNKEKEYLIPLKEMIAVRKNPIMITREKMNLGKREALDWCIIDDINPRGELL